MFALGFLRKLFSALFSGGGSYPKSYHRLVAWVEDNTPAKFDGSQPPGEVEGHLEAKLADFFIGMVAQEVVDNFKVMEPVGSVRGTSCPKM